MKQVIFFIKDVVFDVLTESLISHTNSRVVLSSVIAALTAGVYWTKWMKTLINFLFESYLPLASRLSHWKYHSSKWKVCLFKGCQVKMCYFGVIICSYICTVKKLLMANEVNTQAFSPHLLFLFFLGTTQINCRLLFFKYPHLHYRSAKKWTAVCPCSSWKKTHPQKPFEVCYFIEIRTKYQTCWMQIRTITHNKDKTPSKAICEGRSLMNKTKRVFSFCGAGAGELLHAAAQAST